MTLEQVFIYILSLFINDFYNIIFHLFTTYLFITLLFYFNIFTYNYKTFELIQ